MRRSNTLVHTASGDWNEDARKGRDRLVDIGTEVMSETKSGICICTVGFAPCPWFESSQNGLPSRTPLT